MTAIGFLNGFAIVMAMLFCMLLVLFIADAAVNLFWKASRAFKERRLRKDWRVRK